MSRYVLGLDIGITSVGFGVIDIERNLFVDYGVRLFKEGTAADNETRRTKRGSRRLKRRKSNRLEDMRNLLQKNDVYFEEYRNYNPYQARVKGLKEKLSLEELCAAIMHITKSRGTTLEALADETKDDEGTKAILSKNARALADGKFVCEVQLGRLNNKHKIRGTENNFKTQDYVNELNEILTHQDLDEELCQQILETVARRRRYDQGPGSEKSPTPYGSYRIVDGVLKHVNLIDEMRGRCSVYPDEFRAPKQSYTAELFNLLNDLNNLTIKGEKITIEEKEKVIAFVNEKGNITVKQLLKLLDADEEEVTGFRIDKNEKPLITEFKGYSKVLKAFKKYDKQDLLDDKIIVDNVIDICTKAKGIDERKDTIKVMYPEFNDDLVCELASIKGVTGYHSLSFKAMHEINKEMLTTEMNQMQVLHEIELFDKNRKSLKGMKNIEPDEEAILSPVAKRAHRETFKVINALRKKYGEFDSIVIEMTRDKNSKEQTKRINDNQKRFENENKQVDELIKNAGIDLERVNGKTKTKVKLYLQQDCKTAYTQQDIDLHTLIFDDKAYEIDHIIPLSISLDDSLSNKVLTSRLENQQKGNLTPIMAYLKGRFTEGNLEKYKSYVYSNKKFPRKKRNNLLEEQDITKEDVTKSFINRNLVDTSYACRTVLNTLQHYFKDNDIRTNIHTIRGQATNIFRKKINLSKDREQDYFHHAIDALIVASIKKVGNIKQYMYLDKGDTLKDIVDEETGEVLKIVSDEKFFDPKYIEFISTLKNIYHESNQYNLGYLTKEQMNYPLIKVSHKIDTKPNRQIADETIYSTRNVDGQDMLVEKIKNIYDPKEKKAIELVNNIINDDTDKYIMKHKDPQTFEKIKEAILNHFNDFKDSKEYYVIDKKGKYALKGENPLTAYRETPITKYSKKNNGPAITSIKFYSEKLGNHLPITDNYNTNNKKVILKQISPYRTDFYVSPEGKYKFVTVRYKDVFYKETVHKFVIDEKWYNEEKVKKGIDSDWKFVCSMHRDELIGVIKKEGQKYVYDAAINGGQTQYHDGKHYEILKFTATNNDKAGMFEVKPINTQCKKQLMPSIGPIIKVQKFATDVLGNMYEIKENRLKLEFD